MPPTTTDFLGTTIHKFEIVLGPLPITGFGIAMLMAFLIGQFVATSELTRRGQHDSAEAMGDIVVGAVIGGLLGAKIYYMILFHESFFSRGGFVFWGGLIGGITATAIVIRMKKLPFTRISDATAIGLAAAYSVGRSGCGWTRRGWRGRRGTRYQAGAFRRARRCCRRGREHGRA